ncbi:leucyl aminopeptidase [Pholiota molesta]|nr:leucyl aminopeptidase [Pholiota molesta]
MAEENPYRLPSDVRPTHYDLTVKTDLEELVFQGYVKISLDVKSDTSKIVLNVLELELGNASMSSTTSNSELVISSSSYDQTSQRVTYQLKDMVLANSKLELKIPFSGNLRESAMGYFRSFWEDKGKKKFYSVTRFQPTSARRAFPCWDEPLLKATFAITLISRADTVSLSNMPAVSEEIMHSTVTEFSPDPIEMFATLKNESWKITKYETTPPMSSYLVAFANGYFEFLETSVVMPLTGKTLPLRIYATSDLIHQAQFALDITASVLPLYEKIFDVAYPLPKLDTLIAHDMVGAMENWGLVIGTMNMLLVDPVRGDQQAKKQVASTQSHEVAHMWFGNVTTMEWWDNLYLNEGFATLMGQVIVLDRIFPNWRLSSEFIAGDFRSALALDSKLSSHPIEVSVADANDIGQIFDTLSYSKSASILRMLSRHVGEEKFLKGVSLYLKQHLFSNTVTRDLWDGISTVTGLDIADLMENWITKIGYPVLSVTEDATGIKVRQDRFLETGPSDSKDNETIWFDRLDDKQNGIADAYNRRNVPLSLLSTKNGQVSVDTTIVLREREMRLQLDTTKPFKLNAGTTGFYRVLYTPERLMKIAVEAANDQTIFSLDEQTGLLQDAFAFSQAGFSTLSSSLTLVDIWKNVKEYLVWNAIGNSLEEICSIWWENFEVVEGLDAFRCILFAPLVERLGYKYSKNESTDRTLLRTLAITQAARAGHEGVTKELQRRFKQYMEGGDDSGIPPDLQAIIFSTAVKYGGCDEYELMVKILDKPTTLSERRAALLALGASPDPVLLQKTADFVATKARDSDITMFFRGLIGNFQARRFATKYLFDNYDTFYNRLKDNLSLPDFIRLCVDFYSNQADYTIIGTYFKNKDTSKYNLSLAQALDSIQARSGYIERSTADLLNWLRIDRLSE